MLRIVRFSKCRASNRVMTHVDVPNDVSTADILDMISEATAVPVNCLELRGGYPVTRIDIPEDGSVPAIDGLGITPNDVLIVQATPGSDSGVPTSSEVKPQSGGGQHQTNGGDATATMVCIYYHGLLDDTHTFM